MMIRNGKKQQQQQHLNKVREENRLTYPFQQWGGIKKKKGREHKRHCPHNNNILCVCISYNHFLLIIMYHYILNI